MVLDTEVLGCPPPIDVTASTPDVSNTNIETGVGTVDEPPIVSGKMASPCAALLLPRSLPGPCSPASAGPPADARPAADPPARASAKPCLPARGLVVAKTIRRNLKNGSEVTEPLADGGYRITRCDKQGRTTISMTVLPIADTGGKLVPAPRGDRATQVDHRPDVRRPGPRHALPRGLSPRPAQAAGQRAPADPGDAPAATPPSDPGNVFATAAAQSACNDKTHAESPGTWPENRYAWRWNAKTFGENSSTLTAFKKAHEQWDKTVTDCSA